VPGEVVEQRGRIYANTRWGDTSPRMVDHSSLGGAVPTALGPEQSTWPAKTRRVMETAENTAEAAQLRHNPRRISASTAQREADGPSGANRWGRCSFLV